jgi:UPF0716 protein FxsA
MFAALLLIFVVAPLAELYVIVQVAHSIGALDTVLLLFLVSVIGASLAKRQGLAVLRRMQLTVAEGRVPSRELVDGALIVLAAALMIAPGFISDVLAVLLLLPPTRALVRATILRRIRAGGAIATVIAQPIRRRGGRGSAVWDVESWEEPPHPPNGRRELGP